MLQARPWKPHVIRHATSAAGLACAVNCRETTIILFRYLVEPSLWSSLNLIETVCYIQAFPGMAALPHSQSFSCPACDLLRSNFRRLLDTYREVCLDHLELGIQAVSTRTRELYHECKDARDAWLRHFEAHGCQERERLVLVDPDATESYRKASNSVQDVHSAEWLEATAPTRQACDAARAEYELHIHEHKCQGLHLAGDPGLMPGESILGYAIGGTGRIKENPNSNWLPSPTPL